MISNLLVKLLGDLICSKSDGSISMSRLAACTAHFLAAGFFIYYNAKDPFNEILWMIYLGFATGHAIWDKSWMTTKGKAKDEQ